MSLVKTLNQNLILASHFRTEKSSFNYLLLDPRVTKNLPSRALQLNEGEVFQIFISAVFYVGKGKGSRPLSNLREALNYKKVPLIPFNNIFSPCS